MKELEKVTNGDLLREILRRLENNTGVFPGVETSSNEHKIVCSMCKKNATVPFKPRRNTDLFCRECYYKVHSTKNVS